VTVLGDEALCQQLTEYASALADVPEFLDQVKERIELLMEDLARAEDNTKGFQEELSNVDEQHAVASAAIGARVLKDVLAEVSHDAAILIDWALDAGADPEAVDGFKSLATAEAVKARAAARAAF
jgi:cell division septum initiation protein DivIVA